MKKAEGILKNVSIFDKNTLLKNPNKFWKDVRAVGEKAFSWLKIETLIIPNDIKLCIGAFKDNKSIKNIVLPNSLEAIPAESFSESSIANVNIPQNVTGIGSYAFAGCKNLKHINLPNGIKTIYAGAFLRSGLKEITIPISVQTIQDTAFMLNESLEHITIENNKTDIDWSSFQNCSNIKTITISENKFTIPNYYHFYTMFKDSGKNLIAIVKDEKEKLGMVFLNDKQVIFVPNIDQSFVENLDMYGEEYDYSLLKIWQQQKQNNPSNAVKKMALPEYAVMTAIGDDKQLINNFFKTKTNGYDLLKTKEWYRDLGDCAKSCIIRLFASMGGFEENAAHQKRVVEILDKYINNLTTTLWGNLDDTIVDYFENIPQGLDHIKTKVIEYEHDKDNKIVYKNGFPVIKCEKTVKYYKQICDFFEKNYYRKNFDSVVSNVVINYPLLHKHYKKQLAKLNPNRNPNDNLDKYNKLKQSGIDIKFALSCKNAFKYFYKNEDLIDGLQYISEYDLDQELVSAYDAYLTEAKKITKKAIEKNERIKVFAENVIDNSDSKMTYFWPPITSAVALTIGSRFETCYAFNGANESALISVLTKPKDAIILIQKYGTPIAYCRVNYDEENNGILIDNIEIDENLDISNKEKVNIWETCVRAVMDMKNAMNKEGLYKVERINCKPDPYNSVFKYIKNGYPTIKDIKAKKLQERHYSTKREIYQQEYYASYDHAHLSQIVIDAPEL